MARATWSDRVPMSPAGVNAAYPAAAGTASGDVRVWYMDQRLGRWNVWYRASSDLGATWSRAVRISDVRSGTAYKKDKDDKTDTSTKAAKPKSGKKD